MIIQTKQDTSLSFDAKKSPPIKATPLPVTPPSKNPFKLNRRYLKALPPRLPSPTGTNPTKNPSLPKQNPLVLPKEGALTGKIERVAINIADDHLTNAGIKAIKKSLEESGVAVMNVLSSFGIITGWVQKSKFKELAALPGVKSVKVSPRY
jgi:hypothetical protein